MESAKINSSETNAATTWTSCSRDPEYLPVLRILRQLAAAESTDIDPVIRGKRAPHLIRILGFLTQGIARGRLGISGRCQLFLRWRASAGWNPMTRLARRHPHAFELLPAALLMKRRSTGTHRSAHRRSGHHILMVVAKRSSQSCARQATDQSGLLLVGTARGKGRTQHDCWQKKE
jgi:hypothetical protein